MGAHVVMVPDVGEGIAEVELVSWSVASGDEVRRNQILAEVMTDKANVEIPAPLDGVIAATHGEPGDRLAVGTPLVQLTVDADVDGGADGAGDAEPALAPLAVSERQPRPEPVPAVRTVSERQRVGVVREHRRGVPRRARPRAAPAVRHRARQEGIDLRLMTGTGPAGRITHDDLDGFAAGPSAPTVEAPPSMPSPERLRLTASTAVEERPIIGVRRLISERMVASATSIPHITYVEEIDVTELEALRSTLNESRPDGQARLTLLPFLIRALVNHLPEHPELNAHVDDDEGVLRMFGAVHVGLATQTPNGLVVPVIRHAEAETIWTLAERITMVAGAARDGSAEPSQLAGSTITITSLGPMGGLVTTPIINKPEVAIIGVNKIAVRPVWRDDAFVPRKIMNLSSSFDHRVIDGWQAAEFVQRLRASLEQPALLFVDRP